MMGVVREADRIARIPILVDLAGNPLVEQLCPLKSKGAIDKVVLIINHD